MSVQRVTLAGKHGLFAAVKSSPASTTARGDGFGASHGRSSSKQLVQLSFGEGIGKDESPVLEATGAKHDRGEHFINSGGGLNPAHVGAGAVGAGDGHWNLGMALAPMVGG